jgi:hypothetical protein
MRGRIPWDVLGPVLHDCRPFRGFNQQKKRGDPKITPLRCKLFAYFLT